ncbi:hypothetical protein [Mycolicibacterium sphagni]|uniref:Uncharacterized protein n=1 Tax=Mycolicibacterium sphagni TaxID=1786 RepID=A0A255DWW0_9MYCO|nr:hypothetical protein [Mycolicibacterium sphagni]OYN81755.1 hypothetical protein CG716_05265 [Mycolicibacterium sphagni]
MTKAKPIGVGICIKCQIGGKSLLRGGWCQECKDKHKPGSTTGVAGVYAGGPIWAVRWSEKGFEPRISSISRNEDEVRGFYNHLVIRYAELGREDKPELLAARIHWVVQE